MQTGHASVGITFQIDRTDHKVGEKPVLRLVVTNTTDQPCVRDLDGSRQEIVVWSGDGATRLPEGLTRPAHWS